ncbi:MAG TPA: carboxypeptidase regulatory-like domain-containing protein [Acidobacteriaceae bacterium]
MQDKNNCSGVSGLSRKIGTNIPFCWIVAYFLVLFAVPHQSLWGQAQNTGTVSGNITDTLGAVLPNAEVMLTSLSTGQVTHVTSNGRGEYLLNDVHVGQYRLHVNSPGFGAFTVNNVAVDADQNVRIDAQLKPGTVEASVVVEEAGASIDTRSATIGTLVPQKLIDDLPIDSNNVVALAGLLPGVVNVNSPTTFTGDTNGPTYNASGSRSNQNLMLLDGMMWNNVFYNTGLNFPPSQALQEVSVLLSNYKAQYGRNAGSVFNVITRAGSNRFHGTLWEFLQNKAFNASDRLSHVNPKLVQNQFGGTIGGPILRNRAFFFTSFQDLRVAQQVTAQDFLLTPLERGYNPDNTEYKCNSAGPFAGDTCASFTDGAKAQYTTANPPITSDPAYSKYLYNPLYTVPGTATSAFNAAWLQAGNTGPSPCVTLLQNAQTANGAFLPYAELPRECFNPVAVAFEQKYVPMSVPYSGSGAFPYTTTATPQPRNDKSFLIRGDVVHGSHSVDMRYYWQAANDITSNGVSAGQGIANYEPDLNQMSLNFGSIGDTWILRSNLLNVFRAGYKRYDNTISPTDPTTLSTLGANMTLPTSRPVLPTIAVYNRFSVGNSASAYAHVLNQTLEFNDNVSWTRGAHNYQFGVSWLHLTYASFRDYPGYYSFTTTYTHIPAADLLAGLPNQEIQQNSTSLNAAAPNLYLYAQDDWRASSKLTLNYGLRWEIPYMWHAPHGRSATFIPGYQSQVFPEAPANLAYIGDHGINSTLISTPYKDLAPRIGFAYNLRGNGRTLIRGGFGIFFDAINASVVGVATPFHYSQTIVSPAGGLSDPLMGYGAIPPNYTRATAAQSFVSPYSIYYPDPHFSTPYTQAVNIGLLQQVRKHGFFEADYVVKLSRHQIIPVDRNPAIYDCAGAFYQMNPTLYCPSFTAGSAASSYMARVVYPGFNYGGQAIVDLMTEATSNYHGLQLIGGIRGYRFLSFQASYTYSESMSEQDNGLTTSASLADVWPKINIRHNYGHSSFDSRHVLNLSWVLNFPNLSIGSRFDKAVLRDWTFSGVYSARTGMPFDISTTADAALTREGGQRAELIPGANPYLPSGRSRQQKITAYFNTAAFRTPATGTLSALPRNYMYGPGYISVNTALGRTFRLWKGGALVFRADAFNVFNMPNLGNPLSSLTSGAAGQEFGQIVSTAGTNGVVATNGRRLQLSLSLKY